MPLAKVRRSSMPPCTRIAGRFHPRASPKKSWVQSFAGKALIVRASPCSVGRAEPWVRLVLRGLKRNALLFQHNQAFGAKDEVAAVIHFQRGIWHSIGEKTPCFRRYGVNNFVLAFATILDLLGRAQRSPSRSPSRSQTPALLAEREQTCPSQFVTPLHSLVFSPIG